MSTKDNFLESLGGQIADLVMDRMTSVIEELTNSDKILYTEQDAAELLSMDPHTLGNERRDGRIVGIKVRQGKVRYLRSDLLKYAQERRIHLPMRSHENISIGS